MDYAIEPIFSIQTPPTPKLEIVTPEIKDICMSLLSFARYNKYRNLAGLAANQVSVNGERCMLNVCFVAEGGKSFDWLIAINPEIEKSGASWMNTESCLTWPDPVRVRALRQEHVKISYTNLAGEVIKRETSGFEAIVWQHELNHLLGVAEEIMQPIKAGEKIGPNELCRCGSGKKSKRCCGR